jgi:hypothetical protein
MTDHPSLEELADLAEGLSSQPQHTEHVAGCPECSVRLADLSAVSAELAALPKLAVPADVAARLEQALGAERARATGTVVPLARPRPRVPAWMAAAAVALVAIGGSALAVNAGLFDGLGSKGSPTTAAQDGAKTAGPVLAHTGFGYTQAGLRGQVAGLLSGKQPGSTALDESAGSGTGAAAPNQYSGVSPAPQLAPARTALAQKTARLNALTDQTKLVACLANALGPEQGVPLAVDLASFNGSPAVLAAYDSEGHPGQVDVFVLDPSCPQGSFLYFARIDKPGAK